MLLDRVKTINLLFLDSLKVAGSIDVFKEARKKKKNLSLSSIYDCLFAKSFDAHDVLGDCKALSEVLSAIFPDINVKQFVNIIHTVEEMKNAVDIRTNIRCKVISMQELPISKTMKEKMAKAGIGFVELKSVYSNYGSRGLVTLFTMPVKGMTSKKAPKDRKILANNYYRKVI